MNWVRTKLGAKGAVMKPLCPKKKPTQLSLFPEEYVKEEIKKPSTQWYGRFNKKI